jgi:hypothetical protein
VGPPGELGLSDGLVQAASVQIEAIAAAIGAGRRGSIAI